MKRKLIFMGIIIGSFLSVCAKEIEGVVLSSDSVPIELANIAAFANDSLVGGGVTDSDGFFRIEAGADCNRLRVSCVGYDEIIRSPVNTDMGNIILKQNSTTLKEVVVKAPLITREADRIVLNVAANPKSANKNVQELLKTAPGVWADDKDLSIYGKNNVAVYIDDHKVNLSGVELMNYLKTVQSSSIGTIEILPQGGAEYSANYTGGVILIKLKRSLVDGVSGVVGLSYTIGKYKQWINPFVNLGLHSGKWTFNFNGSLNGCPSERSTGYNDYYNSSISQTMNNTTSFRSKALQGNAMVGIFYEPTDRDKLGLQLDYNYSTTHKTNISRTLTTGGGIDATTDGIYKNKEIFHNLNAALNWKHDLDEEGSELKLIANYNHQSSSVGENNEMKWSYTSNDSVYSTDNRNLYNILTADFSLKKVFNPKWTLNAGSKFTHNGVNNRSQHFYLKKNMWSSNPGYDFDDNYHENIAALYVTTNGNAGRWKFKAGFRGEYYNTGGFMKKQNRFDIFPNANIGFDITENGGYNVTLGYYRNISRPSFKSLNPIVIQNSDYYYSIGNPELTPCYTNSMSLAFILDRRFTIAMGFSETKNPIRQTIISKPDYPERMYLTWANMGKERQGYIHADGFINITQWWNLYASATYCFVSQQLVDSDPFDNFGFLQIIGSTYFNLPWELNLSVSCFYNTKRKQGSLTIYPMLFVTPRIEKQLGKQWTISLSAEDMLQRISRFKTTSNGYDVISSSKSHIAVNLGITYKFSSGKGFRSPRIEKNIDNSRFSM